MRTSAGIPSQELETPPRWWESILYEAMGCVGIFGAGLAALTFTGNAYAMAAAMAGAYTAFLTVKKRPPPRVTISEDRKSRKKRLDLPEISPLEPDEAVIHERTSPLRQRERGFPGWPV